MLNLEDREEYQPTAWVADHPATRPPRLSGKVTWDGVAELLSQEGDSNWLSSRCRQNTDFKRAGGITTQVGTSRGFEVPPESLSH